MEEIAHFRAFVAAQSSKLLNRSETHLQHAVDAVDAVVANLGMPALWRHCSLLCLDALLGFKRCFASIQSYGRQPQPALQGACLQDCMSSGVTTDSVTEYSCLAGPLPQGVEALLVHSDNVTPPPVQLSLTAECPKVGISLELADDWPARSNVTPEVMFYHLEFAIRGVSADVRPTGDS